jgi:hypothetical protein
MAREHSGERTAKECAVSKRKPPAKKKATKKRAPPSKKKKTTKKKPGRPAWKPSPQDREVVKAMAGYGIPQEKIARVLKIAEMTLRKHCRDELDLGETLATAKVAESLYKQAVDGNVGACCFWLKTRAGWRERPHLIPAPADDPASLLVPEEESSLEVARRIMFALELGAREKMH